MSEKTFLGYCGNQRGAHVCIYHRHLGPHSDGVVTWTDEPVQESEESWQAAAAMHRTKGSPMPTSEREMLQTMDAAVWAKGFVEHVKANPSIATDEATMGHWFANAIRAGYDRRGRGDVCGSMKT